MDAAVKLQNSRRSSFVSPAIRRITGSRAKLKIPDAAVKVAVHRLRKRYRVLIRAEIAQTVATADEVEAELIICSRRCLRSV
jgi:hypothetical protein